MRPGKPKKPCVEELLPLRLVGDFCSWQVEVPGLEFKQNASESLVGGKVLEFFLPLNLEEPVEFQIISSPLGFKVRLYPKEEVQLKEPQPRGLLVVVQDITERVLPELQTLHPAEAEAAVKEMQMLIDDAFVPIWGADRDWKITVWSPKAEIAILPRGITKSAEVLVVANLNGGLHQSATSESQGEVEDWTKWLHCVPIVAVNCRGEVIEWNDKVSMMTGRKLKEVFGRSVEDVLTQGHEVFKKTIELGLKGREELAEFDIGLRGKHGEEVILRMSAGIFRDADGHMAGVVAGGQDVTSIRSPTSSLNLPKMVLNSANDESWPLQHLDGTTAGRSSVFSAWARTSLSYVMLLLNRQVWRRICRTSLRLQMPLFVGYVPMAS